MSHVCNLKMLIVIIIILNKVIESIHYYHNILFVIVCLLRIHNIVGVKHDVSSVLYQHCQYEASDDTSCV